MEYVICHYHEIGLKGKNRKFFEEKLISNIKRCLKPAFFKFVKRISGRIIVELTKEGRENLAEIEQSLKNVFGIAYFSFAQNCDQNIEAIKQGAKDLMKDKNFKTFRITTERSKKEFYLTSQKVNEMVGEYIVKNLKKKVNLKEPDLTCFIEIVERYAFLYLEKVKGLGGLPVTTGGKAIALLSGGIDSPVAAFYLMKRGVKIIFVHFHAFPYTSPASIDKAEGLVKILNRYQFSSKLYLIPFTEIQKEILFKTPSKLRVVLYRRFMLRIAQEIATKEKALALVTGESVGQVASQTLENIRIIEQATDLPILRPLIGQDKQDIINQAKTINTFDVSILPHQDCCSRFIPAHPETGADLDEVAEAESKLDLKKLIQKALAHAQLKNFDLR